MAEKLAADLQKLSRVPDETIRRAAREQFVKEMARQFQVPIAFAEMRLAGMGPFLPKEPTP